MKPWPARFERARERLTALRLRLAWEGRERVLWVEAARQEGAQVVSRWHDVEWALAGERLPVNRDTSDARLDALVEALRRFLTGPAPP
jgi:hypothetical protein